MSGSNAEGVHLAAETLREVARDLKSATVTFRFYDPGRGNLTDGIAVYARGSAALHLEDWYEDLKAQSLLVDHVPRSFSRGYRYSARSCDPAVESVVERNIGWWVSSYDLRIDGPPGPVVGEGLL